MVSLLMYTRFSSLQMECGLLLVSVRRPFALKSGSDAVQIKVVTAVVQRCLFAVHVAPIGTRLRLLVEGGAVRTQESEVLHLIPAT